jgi:hypothetical protein
LALVSCSRACRFGPADQSLSHARPGGLAGGAQFAVLSTNWGWRSRERLALAAAGGAGAVDRQRLGQAVAELLADYFHTNDALLQAKEAKLGVAEVARLGFIDRWGRGYGIQMDLALVMKESGFPYYFETMLDQWIRLDETPATYCAALYQRLSVRDASKKRQYTVALTAKVESGYNIARLRLH